MESKKQARFKRWVFTCQVNADMPDLPEKQLVVDWLTKYSSDAVFQKEAGETTGRLHYQGRFTLKSGRISKTGKNDCLKKQIEEFGLNWAGFTFNQEFDEIKSKEYCTKSKTRIEGPWRIGDEAEYRGKDLGLPLRPWQKSIKEFMGVESGADLSRTVISIYDKNGNSGKSWWIKEMRVNHSDLKCFKLPLGNFDRTISVVCKRVKKNPDINAFCIDMTRTMGKDVSLTDTYAAIEEIKGGYLVDTMYGSGEEVYFEPPKIILMHNNDLYEDYQKQKEEGKTPLSTDRYIFLEIKDRDKPLCWRSTQNKELIDKYIPNVLNPCDSCYINNISC